MTLRNIRLFRYDKTSGRYEYEDYMGTASMKEAAAADDSGIRKRHAGSIRIMTSADISADTGDYASLYREEQPDKSRDFIIAAVKDNRRGSLPHWRLSAE